MTYESKDCRKIIDALAKEDPPLEDTINICTKIGIGSYNIGMLANSITAPAKLTMLQMWTTRLPKGKLLSPKVPSTGGILRTEGSKCKLQPMWEVRKCNQGMQVQISC